MIPFPPLSNREREVIKLLLEGKSNKLIALDMKISERTVEFHLNKIFTKFQVNSRLELVLRLQNEPNGNESEKLGVSTVAKKSNFGENDAGPNFWNWVTSLREAVSKIGEEFRMKNSSDANTDNPAISVTFFESIRTCLSKYAEFTGRASRSEFWWFTLFVVIGTSAFVQISEAAGSIFLLAFLLPFLAAGSRRLRDGGKNPWELLFLLLPVGGIILLGFYWALPSSPSFSEENTLPT